MSYYTEADYDNPLLAAFREDQIIHLGGGGLTPQQLEFILRQIEKQPGRVGKIALIAVGKTSIVDICLSLIDYASKIKDAKEVIDKVRESS